MSGVVVEQAARDAAAAWAKSNSRHAQAANILRGSCDNAPVTQAFQRAILAERERCAAVVRERLYPSNPVDDWTDYARNRAEACNQAWLAILAQPEQSI